MALMFVLGERYNGGLIPVLEIWVIQLIDNDNDLQISDKSYEVFPYSMDTSETYCNIPTCICESDVLIRERIHPK
jgi:hypothetical protein